MSVTCFSLGRLPETWPHFAVAALVVVMVVASCHVILYKRDSRAAVAWVGLIWLVPAVGALLYSMFGVNRLKRRANRLRSELSGVTRSTPFRPETGAELSPLPDHLARLAALVGQVTHRPLLPGNRIQPLQPLEQTYPAMVAAIEQATSSVALATYIFDHDRAGQMFLEALGRAVKRGVEVRVLIDDVGAQYSVPSIIRPLRRHGVKVARFLPHWLPWAFPYANLRNHRKLLVIDGRVGFTGGFNIREGHHPPFRSKHPITDFHFQVEGPVVRHLMEIFADDWRFTTREVLGGLAWFPPLAETGPTLARGISDGPDDDFEKLRWTLLGALACAHASVRIMTPYFLPDAGLITALNTAALRGVEVDIVLPARNNLRFVQWASTAQLWQVLERGCRIWLTPPPFDHTKLMVVDQAWSLIGSANWDARSLRLNFEFNVECYDAALGKTLAEYIRARQDKARRLTLAEVDGRSLPARLRDGLARLLSPYL